MSRRQHHVATEMDKGAAYPLATLADEANDAAGLTAVSDAVVGDQR